MNATTSSNHLALTEYDFSDYHIQTAEKLYSLMDSGNPGELAGIINNIPNYHEKYLIHLAFFDKYGVSYEEKIYQMAKDYIELLKYGLTR